MIRLEALKIAKREMPLVLAKHARSARAVVCLPSVPKEHSSLLAAFVALACACALSTIAAASAGVVLDVGCHCGLLSLVSRLWGR